MCSLQTLPQLCKSPLSLFINYTFREFHGGGKVSPGAFGLTPFWISYPVRSLFFITLGIPFASQVKSLSSLVSSFLSSCSSPLSLVEHSLGRPTEKECKGRGWDFIVWKKMFLFLPSLLIGSLACYRILGWKLFSLSVLNVLLCCFLASRCCCWAPWCHSGFWSFVWNFSFPTPTPSF